MEESLESGSVKALGLSGHLNLRVLKVLENAEVSPQKERKEEEEERNEGE